MPNTPEVWLSEFFTADFAGAQREPQITQLTDGRILVAWEDDTDNVDASSGTDIIGQIYDPLGNALGAAFQMNQYQIDDEGEFEIAATPNGGWVLVHEDTSGTNDDISITRFDSSGSVLQNRQYTEPSGEFYNDPTVAVNGAGDIVVAWNVDNGTSVSAHYVFYDESANSWSPTPISHLASSDESQTGTVQNLSVAALSNNDFVLVTNRDNTSAEDVIGRLINSDGTQTGTGFFPIGDVSSVSDHDHVDVIGLTGGGFVAVWREYDGTDRDAYFRVYDNSGTAVTARTGIGTTGSSDDKNELSVAALADGGFVVVYDDDELNTIAGQRYNATGGVVGSAFTITDSSSESQPEVVGLADGRFMVTWQTTDGLGGQSIESEIFDVRDAANSPVYSPETYIIGTIGDDSISDGGGFFDQIFGHDGDDTISISGADAGESADGGDGNDWLVGSGGMAPGTVYNLNTGATTSGSNTQSTTNFENVQGSSASEILQGSDGVANEMNGGGGNDFINGGDSLGRDTLRGEDGDDTITNDDNQQYDDIYGGTGTDTFDASDRVNSLVIDLAAGDWGTLGSGGYAIFGIEVVEGGSGNDRIVGFADFTQDTLRGNDGNDTIIGANEEELIEGGEGHDSLSGGGQVDTINGGEGNDTIQGGAARDIVNGGNGDDTFIQGDNNADDIDGGAGINTLDATSMITNSLTVAGFNNGASYSTFGPAGTLRNIDIVLGSEQDDDINANGANPATIEGNGGNDLLRGGTNYQEISGGDGNDTIDGGFFQGSGVGDLLSGDGGNDDITGANGADTIYGGTGDDTINSNNGADDVRGDAGADLIDGGLGDDTLRGGTEADTIEGSAGEDLLSGQDGDDELFGGVDDDRLFGGDGNDELNGEEGNDFADGGLGDDVLRGDIGNDELDGQSGADTLAGNEGADTLRGGAGDDQIFGGDDNDDIDGEDGNDYARGGLGDDFMRGGDGADDLDGQSGMDTISGNDGDDLLRGGYDADEMYGGNGLDTMAGNDGNDTMRGGNDYDRIFGGGDNDDLDGEGGDDYVVGGTGNDIVRGGTGDDELLGQSGADTLAGNDGNDSLDGGNDNDRLIAGLGTDTVTGGAGADTFVWTSALQSPHGAARDTITDFEHNVDLVDLSGLASGLTFVAAYTGAGNEVRYNDAIGRLYVDFDGDMASDFSIDFDGAPIVDAGDLIL